MAEWWVSEDPVCAWLGWRSSPGIEVVAARVGWRVSGRVRAVLCAVKDSPRTGWLPVRDGQASQCRPGCALQTTTSVERMSCGCSIIFVGLVGI